MRGNYYCADTPIFPLNYDYGRKGSKGLITIVIVSPGFVGPLPNGILWLINGG